MTTRPLWCPRVVAGLPTEPLTRPKVSDAAGDLRSCPSAGSGDPRRSRAMTTRLVLLGAAWGVACFFLPGLSARADSKKSESVDAKLLESLNADPLDDFDLELFAPDADKVKRPPTPGAEQKTPAKEEEWKRRLLEELGAASVSEDENPLLDIARRMREVEGLIAETKSGETTQGIQRQIVASLGELIQQARSCSKKCGASKCSPKVAPRRKVNQPKSKPKPGRGKPTQKRVDNPITQPGQAAPGPITVDQMKELIKSVWGELPESEREQMLEWAGEEFLPKYQVLIELYFRRLAEERRAGRGG